MAQMCNVYQNSHVTIVAASASSSDEGFLTLKNVENDSSFQIPWHPGQGNDISYTVLSTKTDKRGNEREPLHERAWTLQECFLAPRLLVFGQNCMIWKCEQGDESTRYDIDWNRYCELAGLTTIRLGRGGRVFRPVQTTSTASSFASIFNGSRAERVPEIFRVWKLMVKDYSSRRLTDSRDKLPALSGIVTYFQRAMEDDYLAGLWRQHLVYDLSWMSRDAARPLLWRCPSWSWMSVDGPITFQGDRIEWFEPMINILACHVQPVVESARFGHVKSGSLVIRGYLRRNEEVAPGLLAFAQYSDDESLFGNIIWTRNTRILSN